MWVQGVGITLDKKHGKKHKSENKKQKPPIIIEFV